MTAPSFPSFCKRALAEASDVPDPPAEKLTRPIFILGSHKSGTSLLRSLLDAHPALCVLPKESHFFQWSGRWVDYALRQDWPQRLSREQLIAALADGIEQSNTDWRDPYSDNPSFVDGYDSESFRCAIERFPLDTMQQQIEAYFHSLYYALAGRWLPSDRRVVEKSVEAAEYAWALRLVFPDCQFIHIIRNPYVTLVSLRRSKIRQGRFPAMRPLIRSLYNSAYYLFGNRDALSDYHVMRYEDLIAAPETTMHHVAAFLGIQYLPSLTCPSSCGQPWSGNSTSNMQFSEIVRTPNSGWREQITPLEVHLINRWLWPVVGEYSYEPLKARGRKIWPIRGERPTTYLRNRALAYWD